MARPAPRTYLDHNATSPLRPEARAEMFEAFESLDGNPSSLHREGRAARAALETARGRVAELAGSDAAEVIFGSGGSEAITAAIRGVCERAPANRRSLVVPEIEHSAVLEAAREAVRNGFELVPVPCDRRGRVDADRFLRLLAPNTALACLQWANNETGVVQPVEEIGRGCRERGVPFLLDSIQAAGKVELSLRRSRADLMALSAHKLGGPQGVGALVVRRGIVLAPLIVGGAQERRRRGGTEAVGLAVGFGAAAAEAEAHLAEESEKLLRFRAKLETRLRSLEPSIHFHGQGVPRLPNTVNFAVPGIRGETLVIALDLAGVALSTGSACASGAVEPSHVIRSMGFGEDAARSAVRISMGWSTTEEDVGRFLEAFPPVLRQVREGQPGVTSSG